MFYLILHFQSIITQSLTHCARLVCSSALCLSPCKYNTHTGLWDIQDPTHPECGYHSNSWWLWVSSFLEFPVLTYNLVTNSSWTDSSAQTTQWASLSELIFATNLCESYYPHLNFQTKTLKHSGLPNLKSSWLTEAEFVSKPSQQCLESIFVPGRLTPELVLLPVGLCHFNYKWRKNSLV